MLQRLGVLDAAGHQHPQAAPNFVLGLIPFPGRFTHGTADFCLFRLAEFTRDGDVAHLILESRRQPHRLHHRGTYGERRAGCLHRLATQFAPLGPQRIAARDACIQPFLLHPQLFQRAPERFILATEVGDIAGRVGHGTGHGLAQAIVPGTEFVRCPAELLRRAACRGERRLERTGQRRADLDPDEQFIGHASSPFAILKPCLRKPPSLPRRRSTG